MVLAHAFSQVVGRCIYCGRPFKRGRDKEVAALKKYIVREGDTLESISHETGVEWKLLVAANPGVDGRRVLPPGQVIAVPDIGNGAIRHQPAGVQGSEYAPNPALEKAKRPDKQQPEEKMPGYFGLVWPHVVSSGEDWSTVSQEYQVPLGELLRMNATFANRELAAGDILYIPNVVMESRVSDNGEKAASAPSEPASQGSRGPSQNYGIYGLPHNLSCPAWNYAWGVPIMAYGYPAYAAGYPYGNGTTVYENMRYKHHHGAGPYAYFPQACPPMSWDAVNRMWDASLGQEAAFGGSFESSSTESSWSDDSVWDQNDGKTP